VSGAEHHYATRLVWTGDLGSGTSGYRAYERSHEITAGDKPALLGSSDPAFRGDPSRWNPEDLLVASLSACHMLVFLHRAAVAGVTVLAYEDDASGTMHETEDGGGAFTEVVLRPRVTVETPEMAARCDELHAQAHAGCFIASSVRFPVRHEPTADVPVHR
jgi:organic hydroperoxide reductase OsmC/OhrA